MHPSSSASSASARPGALAMTVTGIPGEPGMAVHGPVLTSSGELLYSSSSGGLPSAPSPQPPQPLLPAGHHQLPGQATLLLPVSDGQPIVTPGGSGSGSGGAVFRSSTSTPQPTPVPSGATPFSLAPEMLPALAPASLQNHLSPTTTSVMTSPNSSFKLPSAGDHHRPHHLPHQHIPHSTPDPQQHQHQQNQHHHHSHHTSSPLAEEDHGRTPEPATTTTSYSTHATDTPRLTASTSTITHAKSQSGSGSSLGKDGSSTLAHASTSNTATSNNTGANGIVRLNVGGTLFCTSADTLLWPGSDTFFAALLSGRMASLRDETGAFFIDREPRLFASLLSFLRTRSLQCADAAAAAELRREADFYGLSQLAHRLAAFENASACGGTLFEGLVQPVSHHDGPIRAITGAHNLVTVAHDHVVTCWRYSEAQAWQVEARSPNIAPERVTALAVRPRLGAGGETFVAIATDSRQVYMWGFAGTFEHRDSLSASTSPLAASRDSGDEEGVEASLQQYDLGVPADHVMFIHSSLVALARCGKVGVRNARTRLWQVQEVTPVRCHDTAGGMLLLGSDKGKIRLMDFEKFAVRLRDMDLLVNVLYVDPDRQPITALSVYESASLAERCMEIAYGTAAGVVRVLIQHPETVGQAPLLYQTYTVHRAPIASVTLSEKYLISVCADDNHVRSWRIARFRGRISTQPGSQTLASFNVPSASTSMAIGPYGDLDQQLVFLQWPTPNTEQLLLRLAANGDSIGMVEAVDGSPVLCAYLHEGGMASRVGSRARRFLCTGHANGTMQVWDLTTALQRGQHAPRASSAAASGAAVVISKEQEELSAGHVEVLSSQIHVETAPSRDPQCVKNKEDKDASGFIKEHKDQHFEQAKMAEETASGTNLPPAGKQSPKPADSRPEGPVGGSMAALLGQPARVEISDGRVMYGRFVGFDRDCNVLLQLAEEWAVPAPARPESSAAAAGAGAGAGTGPGAEGAGAEQGHGSASGAQVAAAAEAAASSKAEPRLCKLHPQDQDRLIYRRFVDSVMVPGPHLVAMAVCAPADAGAAAADGKQKRKAKDSSSSLDLAISGSAIAAAGSTTDNR